MSVRYSKVGEHGHPLIVGTQLKNKRKHTARGGGQLKFLYRFGDLEGMYTDLSFKRMSESLRNNIARVRDSASNTNERKIHFAILIASAWGEQNQNQASVSVH